MESDSAVKVALRVENVRPSFTGSTVTMTAPAETGLVKWAVTLTGRRPPAAADIARAAIAIR